MSPCPSLKSQLCRSEKAALLLKGTAENITFVPLQTEHIMMGR